jgi:hypothetical protein
VAHFTSKRPKPVQFAAAETDNHPVAVVRLRSRAVCRECDSRLPPRTEVYLDPATNEIVCLSCTRRLAPDHPPLAEGEVDEHVDLEDAYDGYDSPAEVAAPRSVPALDRTGSLFGQLADPGEPAAATDLDAPTGELPAVRAEAVRAATNDPATADDAPPRTSAPASPAEIAVTARATVDERLPSPLDARPPRVLDSSVRPKRVTSNAPLGPREFLADGSAAVAPARTVQAGESTGTDAGGDRRRPRLVNPPPAPPASLPTPIPGVTPAAVDGRPPQLGGDPSGDDGPEPHVASAVGLIGRLRAVQASSASARPVIGDSVVIERPSLDTDWRDRGDVADDPVSETLEQARIHGIEILHGYRFDQHTVLDHVVLGTNGIWVVRAGPLVEESLDRRDVGDWFTSDPRLFVGEVDRSDLVDEARLQADAVRSTLAATRNADIPIRPAVCFPQPPPGPSTEPFTVAGVLITWRNRVIEPMLEPVLIDRSTRQELVDFLLAVRYNV